MKKLVMMTLALSVLLSIHVQADDYDVIKVEVKQLKTSLTETAERHAIRSNKLYERELLFKAGKISEGQFRSEELGIYFIFLNNGRSEVERLFTNSPETYFPIMRHLRKLTVAEIQEKSEEFKNPTTLKYLASLN